MRASTSTSTASTNMRTYTNEIDPFAAQWLRNLFPDAVVDERSIREIEAPEATRAHFFAGVGGWELALQLAGWPDGREVWTGSCPCQPFSQAGKRLGTLDPRHLWPEFLRLIAERRPATIFGEQVASRAGREWLAGVRADLEALGYAVGAADLCAASVGAPHRRQRLFWCAVDHTERARLEGHPGHGDGRRQSRRLDTQTRRSTTAAGGARILADSGAHRRGGRGLAQRAGVEGAQGHEPLGSRRDRHLFGAWRASEGIACSDGRTRRTQPGLCPLVDGVPGRVGQLRAYGNALVPQLAAVFVRAFLDAEAEGLRGAPGGAAGKRRAKAR